MEILIGTKNYFKAAEMVWSLNGLSGVNIHYMDELPQSVKVQEDGRTLLENAQKKAQEISRLVDWYVLASDAGVDIPGLGKKWDILRNQRMVGEGRSDREKAISLIALMKGLKGEERKCVNHIALALAKNGGELWSTEDIADSGYIVDKIGEEEIPQSFWIGHLWFCPQYNKTFNQLTLEEKNQIRVYWEPLRQKLQGKN